ncbi:hypothetical protein ACT2UN_005375, partial [Pseudomonas putida]
CTENGGRFAALSRRKAAPTKAACANHKKCLCTSGIGDLSERHAGSLRRWSLRKRLFLLGCSRKQE